MPAIGWIAIGLVLCALGALVGDPAVCGGGLGILIIQAVRLWMEV